MIIDQFQLALLTGTHVQAPSKSSRSMGLRIICFSAEHRQGGHTGLWLLGESGNAITPFNIHAIPRTAVCRKTWLQQSDCGKRGMSQTSAACMGASG